MPIRQYLGTDTSFDPEDLKAMGQAFSVALSRLGLKDRSDPMVEIVALRIIRAATAGERNLIRLTEIATDGQQS